jgi:poly-gamma-glutamate capsule biosynthesis protein CapA/YwtB (metallophosphatase superfamily)
MGLRKMFERVKHPSNGNGSAPAGAGSAEPPLVAAPPNPSELPPRLSESVAVPAAVPELAASDRIVLSPRPRGSGPRFDLLFLGDTSFGENYQAARERRGEENVLKTRPYDDAWCGMRPILAAADLTVANLETPLTDIEESPFEGRKSFIHWGDVVQTPLHLARNHISVVTVANNHGLDYGVAGLEQTLRALDSHGIRRVGSGRTDAEVERPLLIELAGADAPLRIAVFASYLAPRTPSDAGANSGGGARIGLLDPARIAEQIRALKAVDPDLLPIAFPHWGPNYAWRSSRQRRVADQLLKAGVELVLGHGAHNLQQVQRRSNRWVAFGLGNFVFNSPGRYTKSGAPPFSLVARLIARPGPAAWSVSVRLYPTVSDNRLTDYHPRFTTEAEFTDVRELLAARRRGSPLPVGKDRYGQYLRLRVRPATRAAAMED